MTIWFTGCTHLDHDNIIKYCNRPTRAFEHTDWLVRNWNSVVKPEDVVYHLGDLAFAHVTRIKELLEQLHGRIYLIPGNHDRVRNLSSLEKQNKFEIMPVIYEINKYDSEMDQNQRIVLCHYPLESWNCKYHGSWHLHSHSHGILPSPDSMARIDVGVDAQNYFPISYEEVKYRMTQKALRLAKKDIESNRVAPTSVPSHGI